MQNEPIFTRQAGMQNEPIFTRQAGMQNEPIFTRQAGMQNEPIFTRQARMGTDERPLALRAPPSLPCFHDSRRPRESQP
jgi:hypothetical protein